jgi:DNA-binding GntR family transcriptional regulator
VHQRDMLMPMLAIFDATLFDRTGLHYFRSPASYCMRRSTMRNKVGWTSIRRSWSLAANEISQTVGTASLVEWAKLALNEPQSRVLRVTRVRYDIADQPVALEEVVLPLSRFFGLAPDDGDIPDLTELAQRHGISLGRAIERISIVPATKDVASHLGIAFGTDVMKLDRVTETADGEPIEWRVAYRKI